jgi:hypothetical protein
MKLINTEVEARLLYSQCVDIIRKSDFQGKDKAIEIMGAIYSLNPNPNSMTVDHEKCKWRWEWKRIKGMIEVTFSDDIITILTGHSYGIYYGGGSRVIKYDSEESISRFLLILGSFINGLIFDNKHRRD